MEYYLVHHGILGMHWGIRRFQNADGSLTSAGRDRYGVSNKKKSATEDNEPEEKKGLKLTDKQKKYIKIGAAVVAGSLAVAGGVYLAKKVGILNNINKPLGASNIKIPLDKENFNNALSRANDSVKKHRSNGISDDCTNIWAQIAAQANGRVDVEAGDKVSNSLNDLMKYFSKDGKAIDFDDVKRYAESKTTFLNSSQKVSEFITKKFGSEDSWGFISAPIKAQGDRYRNHAMFWSIINGKVYISDGLNGEKALVYFDKLTKSGDDILLLKASDLDMDVEGMIRDGLLKILS